MVTHWAVDCISARPQVNLHGLGLTWGQIGHKFCPDALALNRQVVLILTVISNVERMNAG